MILGEHKRECMGCGKMFPYEYFDYIYDADDIWEQDFTRHEEDCPECYRAKRDKVKKEDVVRQRMGLVERRVKRFIDSLADSHAPQCPICDSKRRCGCYDTDPDGYR